MQQILKKMRRSKQSWHPRRYLNQRHPSTHPSARRRMWMRTLIYKMVNHHLRFELLVHSNKST